MVHLGFKTLSLTSFYTGIAFEMKIWIYFFIFLSEKLISPEKRSFTTSVRAYQYYLHEVFFFFHVSTLSVIVVREGSFKLHKSGRNYELLK